MNARPETAISPAAPLPAEFRSALELAQAAVWDWHVSADHFQVDESWLRALGVELYSNVMPCAGHSSERDCHTSGRFMKPNSSMTR